MNTSCQNLRLFFSFFFLLCISNTITNAQIHIASNEIIEKERSIMLLQKELNNAYQKLITDTGKITALFLQSSKKSEIKSLMVYEKNGELFINLFSRDSNYNNVKKIEITHQVLDELFTPIRENMKVELVGSKSNYYYTFFILKKE